MGPKKWSQVATCTPSQTSKTGQNHENKEIGDFKEVLILCYLLVDKKQTNSTNLYIL